MPDEVVRRFSKRNDDIRDALTKPGYDPGAASRSQHRIAEQRTRNPKVDELRDLGMTLQDLWREEECEAGGDPAEYVQRVFSGGRAYDELLPPAHPHVNATSIAWDLLDPDTGLTSHGRRFSRLDALRRVAAALPTGATTPADIEASLGGQDERGVGPRKP